MAFKDDLREFRTSLSMTQGEFARHTHLDPATISNLEAGRANPGPMSMSKLKKAGFRGPRARRGRPPNNVVSNSTSPKVTVDMLVLAEKILKENAPHLLQQDDPASAAIRKIGSELALTLIAQNTRLEAIERNLERVIQTLHRVEVLSSPLVPPQVPENGPEKSGENA